MENNDIGVYAHQQMKAAIMQLQSIGAKKIVLEGYKDQDKLTVASDITISLAKGQVQLDASMMMSVHATSEDDWSYITDIDKLAKRMPKIEGDKDAHITFQYSPKDKGTGANLVFNDRGTAGKRTTPLPVVPLPNEVEYLPITYDAVAGAIHFNINTAGSEGADIHMYVTMNDFGSVLETKAILSQFNIKTEQTKDISFAKKEAPPKVEKPKKPKTSKAKTTAPKTTPKETPEQKEDDMSTDKKPLPAPSVPKKSKPPVVEEAVPPVVEETETVAPVVEEEETVIPAPAPAPPTVAVVEEEETPAVVDEPEEPGLGLEPETPDPVAPETETESTSPVVPTDDETVTPKKARPSNSKSAKIERAVALLEENDYKVELVEDAKNMEDPLVLLDQIHGCFVAGQRFSLQLKEVLEAGTVDPALAAQIKAIAAQL